MLASSPGVFHLAPLWPKVHVATVHSMVIGAMMSTSAASSLSNSSTMLC